MPSDECLCLAPLVSDTKPGYVALSLSLQDFLSGGLAGSPITSPLMYDEKTIIINIIILPIVIIIVIPYVYHIDVVVCHVS